MANSEITVKGSFQAPMSSAGSTEYNARIDFYSSATESSATYLGSVTEAPLPGETTIVYYSFTTTLAPGTYNIYAEIIPPTTTFSTFSATSFGTSNGNGTYSNPDDQVTSLDGASSATGLLSAVPVSNYFNSSGGSTVKPTGYKIEYQSITTSAVGAVGATGATGVTGVIRDPRD